MPDATLFASPLPPGAIQKKGYILLPDEGLRPSLYPDELSPHSASPHSEAGLDEAGRGCLAGPVVAAAVILGPGFEWRLMADSKALTHEQRLRLAAHIKAHALAWAVGIADTADIAAHNILWASILAMHRAVQQLLSQGHQIAHMVVDGNKFKPLTASPHIPHTCVVKGDAHLAHVAAASIIAKTTRDALMQGLHAQHPAYGWNQNKGYPTAAHRAALQALGPTAHHRQGFAGVPPMQPRSATSP